MARQIPSTAARSGSANHSPPVEELIKKLIGDGSTPTSDLVIARKVTISEDESGSDPYNHTGRFRKIFK